jgi:hypothetical protein
MSPFRSIFFFQTAVIKEWNLQLVFVFHQSFWKMWSGKLDLHTILWIVGNAVRRACLVVSFKGHNHRFRWNFICLL